MPHETGAEGDGGMLWAGVDEVVVGGGAVRSQTLAGGGAWGRKPETELMWLGFGHAVQNGSGMRRGKMAGGCR